MSTEKTLSLRELNRATLARQLLLKRANKPAGQVIQHLVAMQGQVSNAPYVGLWARLRSFKRSSLTSLIENRHVVRAPSLRGTLHILTAEDYLAFHPLLQPALSRQLHLFAQRARKFHLEDFLASMRDYVREQPRTREELRAKFGELHDGMGKQQIVDSVRMHMALIQPPPAGTWGFTGRPTHVEAAQWLRQQLRPSNGAVHQLIRRYLAAFGPASVQDMQAWSGLTKLNLVVDDLRAELRTFRDEDGTELFDLPNAPRPEADAPAPVAFLPDFDNVVFGHADRRRMIPDEYHPLLFNGDGSCAALLVDGFVRGKWRIGRRLPSRGSAFTDPAVDLLIEAFAPLSRPEKKLILEEGERLMRWICDGADTFTIRLNGKG